MRGLGILAAGAAVLVLVVGGRAAAESVTVDNLPAYSEFALSPKALPKRTPAPAALALEVTLPTTSASGAPVPPVRTITLRLDRNIVFDLKRFPSCKADLEHNDIASIRALCKHAIVGEGTTEFLVSQRPVALPGAVAAVLNGGRRGAVRTLYLATYLRGPIVGTVVLPIKIRSVDDGRYGLEASIAVPAPVAETFGSLSLLSFQVGGKFTHNRQGNVVRAKCPDGKLLLSSTIQFADGTQRETESVRPCTGKGGR